LKIFDAPQIPILTYSAQIEAGDAERASSYLRVPTIEPAEKEVRFTIRQLAGFNRVQVVDQEEKDVTVRGVERRRILRDIDVGIVDPRRPVKHTGHFPTCIAGSVAGDLLHGLDEFVIEDTPIVRAGYGPQLGTAVF